MKKGKEKSETREIVIVSGLLLIGLIILSSIVIATPSGPSSINSTSNSTGVATTGKMFNISGGYLSKLNITATSQNPHWKAFLGWINGKFTLDDASGSTIYDWTLSTVSGEVYATRNSTTPDWNSIACATASNITAEDIALEHTGEDNITSTFTSTNTKTFKTAGTIFGSGVCSSINTYVNNVSQSSTFEEVILHDGTNSIFATILEQDSTGYDGNTYDFQMLVPENANETSGTITPYYLYVELG